jgi:hypothetical protein
VKQREKRAHDKKLPAAATAAAAAARQKSAMRNAFV